MLFDNLVTYVRYTLLTLSNFEFYAISEKEGKELVTLVKCYALKKDGYRFVR